MTPEELKKYNKLGFLAGPTENSIDFIQRIKASTDPNLLESLIGNKKRAQKSITSQKWDITAQWIPIIRKSRTIFIWEIARTLVYEANKIKLPIIEIPRKDPIQFKDEILTHEMIHAVRCAFTSSKYEEMIAYQALSNPIRRYFGPLFSTPLDSVIFVLSSFIPLLFSLIFDSFSPASFSPIFLWSSYLIYQLFRKNKAFLLCKKNLSQLLQNPKDVEAISIRLSDLDIDTLARASINDGLQYIQSQKSLQWKQILSSYPLKNIDASFRNN